MVSIGSREMFSIFSLASLLLVFILVPSILSKSFASVLLRFSYELLGSDSTGRKVSQSCSFKPNRKNLWVALLLIST